jgi:hypothetical protein
MLVKLLAHARRHAVGYVALLVALSGVAYAAIPDNGVVHGCYKPASPASGFPGDLVVRDNAAACPAGYTALDWNQQGPTGPTGPTGPAGPQGPTGGSVAFGHGIVDPGPRGGQPKLVFAAHLVSVHRVSVGRYCIKPSFTAAHLAMVGSQDISRTRGHAPGLVLVDTRARACSQGEFEIVTERIDSAGKPHLSNGIAFVAEGPEEGSPPTGDKPVAH